MFRHFGNLQLPSSVNDTYRYRFINAKVQSDADVRLQEVRKTEGNTEVKVVNREQKIKEKGAN